jgi:hypothetical protein
MLLGLAGGALLAGCSSDDTGRAEVAASTGRFKLALTARGSSGNLYRLREAAFQVTEQSNDPFGGFVTFLFSEDDPVSSTLETTLSTGDYTVELFSGWVLEKVENGEVTPVVASLLSSPLQFFGILPNEESLVSYRFETDGEIIEFEQGRLIIDIEVEERAPTQLGEPLEIVDGFIGRGTNEHGIQANLFVASAPKGATIAFTERTGSLCVSGNLDPVEDGDFSTQWGTVFGFEFVSDALEFEPWDRDGGAVDGFAFTLTGPQIPILRFASLPGDADISVDNFCREFFFPASGERLEVPIDTLTRDCWLPGGEPLITDDLRSIAWNIPSNISTATPFEFCVSDVRPILR